MGDIIEHYGIIRRSGRYPWGSGKQPFQSSKALLIRIDELKKRGLTQKEIAASLGMSTTEYRAQKSLAVAERRAMRVSRALRLKDKGWSNMAIAAKLGVSEGSVRSWLKPAETIRLNKTQATTNALRDAVNQRRYIDVGLGAEEYLGVSRTRLLTAIQGLKNEGYKIQYLKVPQVSTGNYTSVMVLTTPDVSYTDLMKNKTRIGLAGFYSEDRGISFRTIEEPASVDRERVYVRYAEDGGVDKDGVIQLRRGVSELDLGEAHYVQARIAVDGTHFMKGMAIYADDIPDGYDIVYNTNKSRKQGLVDPYYAFKKMTNDENSPFAGTSIRQRHYIDKNGVERLSPINIVGSRPGSGEEGAWNKWSKTLSSQILSKQSPVLVQQQLKLDYDRRKREYDEISSLTNPAVRAALMFKFADSADAAAVHLKAAAMPRQANRVILPFNSISPREVYAPQYRDGEIVALIRHPHGGIFEMPELRVNNRNSEAMGIIGRAKDAVGIHPSVAKILSGADFDGDTVLVIPNNDRRLRSAKPLRELMEFDPKVAYPAYEGMPHMSHAEKEHKMGSISNLIMDMGVRGASRAEIVRAVKHSMVVIDAEKHYLNHKLSYEENGIAALKRKYREPGHSGAATLITRASSVVYAPARLPGQYYVDPRTGRRKLRYIDPSSGEKLYRPNPDKYARLRRTTRMAETTDALSLSSGTRVERLYGDYANSLKRLGNHARLAAEASKDIKYSREARASFISTVRGLNAKLSLARRHKPLERRAQILANESIAAYRRAHKDLSADRLKKLRARELERARLRLGGKKSRITITPREWEAIQAGAVSGHKLRQILANTDLDVLRAYAMPKTKNRLTGGQMNRARAMLGQNHTQAEVADALGITVAVLVGALEEDN